MFLIPIDRNSCGSKIISGFRIKTGWQTSWRPSSPSHGISGFWSTRFISLICRNRKHTQNCRLSFAILFWECYCRSKKKLPQSRYVRASVCKNKLGISSNQRLYGTKPGGNFPPVVVRIQRMEGLCRCYLHLHRVHHERTRDSDHEGSSVPTEAVKGWLLFVNIISPLYRNQLSHHDQHCFIVTGICI